MSLSYKGYRVGSIEKNILQLLLGVKDIELPKRGYGPTFADILKTARQKKSFSGVIRGLKEKNLIEFNNGHGTLVVSLTERGKCVTEMLLLEKTKNHLVPQKWNGTWHVVIFDIPEERKLARDMLRSHLKKFGFRHVQASVWAYPYPCENIVALIKTYFELGNEVLYMKVISLEGDAKLKKFFRL